MRWIRAKLVFALMRQPARERRLRRSGVDKAGQWPPQRGRLVGVFFEFSFVDKDQPPEMW